MSDILWNYDEPVDDLIDGGVPRWIEDDLTGADVAAIIQGGCASGAYMPAVTYHKARETMSECGDEVLAYIEASYGELPKPSDDESWSGIAVHYLSIAVELWAMDNEDEIILAIEDLEDEEDEA